MALAMSRHPASIDSLAYVAGDLVTDRVQLLGKIVGSNGVSALLTEQNHVIAYPCRGTWPQINHELVHADSSNHWPELTSDEHLAAIRQSSGVPVGVTHRNGRNGRAMLSGPRASVAHSLPRFHLFEERDVTCP